MKSVPSLRIVIVAGIIALATFAAGYGLAFSQISFGWSEAIVGVVVGGILGIIGGVAGSIVARKSSLETVELSSRLANEHAQHEKLELRAQEIMAKFAHLTKTRHSFMESMARYAAGESAAPNVMVLNEPLVDLEYSVSSSFPELSSLVRGFGIEMTDVFQKLSNLCGEIGAGKEFKGADFLPITGRSLAMEVAIRKYISSKYIRNLDVEVPTIDMIDQMNSDG